MNFSNEIMFKEFLIRNIDNRLKQNLNETVIKTMHDLIIENGFEMNYNASTNEFTIKDTLTENSIRSFSSEKDFINTILDYSNDIATGLLENNSYHPLSSTKKELNSVQSFYNEYKEKVLSLQKITAQNWAVEKLRKAGIEVISDKDEFERILRDNAQIKTEISDNQGNIINEDDDLDLEEIKNDLLPSYKSNNTLLQYAVKPYNKYTINPQKKQVILTNLQDLSSRIQKNGIPNSIQACLDDLKKVFNFNLAKDSNYISQTLNNTHFTLRLSNHNINSKKWKFTY